MTPIAAGRALAALALLALASPLGAQGTDEPTRRASFTAGVSLGDGEPALASTASLAFQFTRRFSVEFELAHARKLDFTLDLCPAPLVCVLGGRVPVTGRTVSIVPHLAIELLPGARRVHAYATAGVGGGHVRQRYVAGPPSSTGGTSVESTRSAVTLAVSFGGGATVRVAPRLFVGVDVRSLNLLDEDVPDGPSITPAGTLSTWRVGSRVTWQF